jgi:hypothetical protein
METKIMWKIRGAIYVSEMEFREKDLQRMMRKRPRRVRVTSGGGGARG